MLTCCSSIRARRSLHWSLLVGEMVGCVGFIFVAVEVLSIVHPLPRPLISPLRRAPTLLAKLANDRAKPGDEMDSVVSSEAAALCAYYAVGCSAYSVLEGWSPLQSLYFLTVTITTVGYGDVVPLSAAGKLFTSVYLLLGIFGAFQLVTSLVTGPLSNAKGWQERLVDRVGSLLGQQWFTRKVDAMDRSLSLREINASINYPRRYLLCLLGPFLVFLGGVAIGHAVGGFPTLGDSIYWAVATMTTVGFGDVTPAASGASQPWGELVAVLYLPVAVIVLADAASEAARITARRSLRETDFSERLGEYLLDECAELGDPDEPLSEAEFLIAVLVERNLVDEQTLMAVRRQFEEVASTSGSSEGRAQQLTADAWFRILRQRGKLPADVDAEAGFGAWYEQHWVPLVQERTQERSSK